MRVRVLFDPTRWDFFDPKGKNWKICDFESEIFQTQTKDGWPKLTLATKKMTQTSLVQSQAPTFDPRLVKNIKKPQIPGKKTFNAPA